MLFLLFNVFRRPTPTQTLPTGGPSIDPVARAAGRAVEVLEGRLLFAASDLDPTFGGDGKVTVEHGTALNVAGDMVLLPDGRFIVAGQGNGTAQLTRYLPGGALDTTFGDDGHVFLTDPDSAEDLLLAPGGKLLVTGQGGTARLNADGTPDSTFGGGDGVAQGISGRALAVQADGKVLVAGGTTLDGSVANDFGLTRLNANGTVDATFGGGDGHVSVDFGGSDNANAVAALPDGRILVAGYRDNLRNRVGDNLGDFAVARFTAAGALDTTFGGGDGKVLTDFGAISTFGNYDLAYDLAVLGNGRFLVGGVAGGDRLAVARYFADGTLDASFGPAGADGDGRTTVDVDAYLGIDTNQEPRIDLAVAPDGLIVIAGGGTMPGSTTGVDFAVARFTAGGAVDNTFGGGDGVAYTDFSGPDRSRLDGTDYAAAVEVLDGGQVLVAGTSGFVRDFAVARYTAAGAPDPAFGGGDGKVVTDAAPFASVRPSPAVLPDGSVLLPGSQQFTGGDDSSDGFTVLKLKPDGEIDTAFADNGLAVAVFPGSTGASGSRVVVLPDGRFYVAGHVGYGGPETQLDLGVALFAADGRLISNNRINPSFEVGMDELRDVALQPDGKLLLAARTFNIGPRIVLVRVAGAGFDGSFGGGDGVVVTQLTRDGEFSPHDEARDVAVLPDGDIVVLAESEFGTESGAPAADFVLVRYNPDGSLDPAFGDGGGFTLSRSGLVNADLAVVGGKLRVAGALGGRMAVAGFNADGSIDTAFGGGDGIATADFGAASYGNEIRPVAGGKFYAAGGTQGQGANNLALARFNADGSLDTTFSGDGKATVDFGNTEIGTSFDVAPDGRVTIAGRSVRQAEFDLVLARFLGGDTQPPPPGGPQQLEAEQAVLRGAVVSTVFPGYSGTGFVDFINAANDYAEFTVNVPAAGSYTLAFRYANGSPAARAMALSVNGAGASNVTFARTASWSDWQTSTAAAAVRLSAGANKVRLTATGQSGPNLDWVTVTPATDQPPAAATTYQAESARRSGAIVSTVFPGYTGSGFIDYLNLANDFVEFDVTAPSAGSYALEFRYANGSGAARGMELRVNGAVKPGGVFFGPTDSWEDWRTVNVTVTLNAGANKVRLSAAGQSGPNLDALTVRPAQPPPTGGVSQQAEFATLVGAVVSTAVPDYTGTGFADFINASGDYVEWAVDVTEARTYGLRFRYGNGSAADRPLRLTLDGNTVRDRLSFGPTGSWSAWRDTEVVNVNLTPGRHRIRLTAIGSSGANIDALTVL